MTPALVTVALVMLGTVHARGQPEPTPPAVRETTVLARAAEQAIVALAAGTDTGVAVGERFWVCDDAAVAGAGTIYFVTGKQSVGRLTDPGSQITTGQPAVVLSTHALSELRDQLGPGVTVRGRISRVPPGRRTAWLDIGREAGLRPQDQILARRNQIPIARGRVEILEDDVALVRLRPVVGNALPEPGDSAELWPAPAVHRQARLNSTVLAVTPDDEGPTMTIVGAAADGLAEERLVDLYRKGKYVGVASIVRVSDPLSEARVIGAASPGRPEVGDLALVRARPTESAKPLAAAIFRVEGDYCLLAAGECDGVQVGEKFVLRRRDPANTSLWREVAELTVRTVKVDYAGAYIRPLTADGARIARWEIAERRVPEPARWIPVGTVETVDASSRSATMRIDPQAGMTPGQVIRWVPPGGQPPGAAIVLHCPAKRAILYVPPGWGELRDLHGARVEGKRDIPCRN